MFHHFEKLGFIKFGLKKLGFVNFGLGTCTHGKSAKLEVEKFSSKNNFEL